MCAEIATARVLRCHSCSTSLPMLSWDCVKQLSLHVLCPAIFPSGQRHSVPTHWLRQMEKRAVHADRSTLCIFRVAYVMLKAKAWFQEHGELESDMYCMLSTHPGVTSRPR